ncbi:MAG: putative succinate dehydrogenase/fumarate reductase Fe-S protein subunit-like protein [Deltaproteobacteria bacterium]|nr:putative succinate dehydrogenase/fumarate reductase Fe-S protein subunit-like protein [Deltaproteobacteria bacterium]
MKEEKDVKGLSRRMLCKLMAGGAVAVGGNCLLPGSPLMAGRNPLIGVKSAEAGADLSQVSILARREIEARILMPVLNAFIKEYGKEKTVKLVDPIIQELAREGGVQLAKALGGNTIAHFAKGLSLWTREDALRLDVKEQTETKFAFNVTRCRYAEMYKELRVQDYGALLSCGRDAALIVGFNPKIKFTRTQTIMSGAPYCDFRYELMA